MYVRIVIDERVIQRKKMNKFNPKAILADRRKLAIVVITIALFFNIILALLKYFIYIRTNLVGVYLDSITSFMDILFSVIALFAFNQLLSPKAKTSSHGYGRIEYVATFAMALVMFGIGVLYFASSINRFPFPVVVHFTWSNLILLVFGGLIKISFGIGFRLLNKKVKSGIFKAFEVIFILSGVMSLLTALSYGISNSYSVGMDAIVTVFESLFYLGAGFIIGLDSIRSLVGRDLSAALKYSITKIIMNNMHVQNIGNIKLHDYGYARIEGTVEVEYDYKEIEDIFLANKEIQEEILASTGVIIKIIVVPYINKQIVTPKK